jgi:hypothetical protein
MMLARQALDSRCRAPSRGGRGGGRRLSVNGARVYKGGEQGRNVRYQGKLGAIRGGQAAFFERESLLNGYPRRRVQDRGFLGFFSLISLDSLDLPFLESGNGAFSDSKSAISFAFFNFNESCFRWGNGKVADQTLR